MQLFNSNLSGFPFTWFQDGSDLQSQSGYVLYPKLSPSPQSIPGPEKKPISRAHFWLPSRPLEPGSRAPKALRPRHFSSGHASGWPRRIRCPDALQSPFSRMRSKGSRLTLGVWGLSCARHRPQPSATVRNRSREVAMAVPMVSSAKGVTFRAFQRRIASFRVAGVALRDFPTCFTTCHRSFCGRRNTFATFSEDALHFSLQAQHFEDLRCHFAWQAQHFRRVVLRIFCKSHCQRCAKWWQGANSVAGGAFCDRWWKSTKASHETSILRSVRKKTRRKTSILTLRSVKCNRTSRTKCSFWCSNMSRLESRVFLWRRRVYGGSCETSPDWRFQNRL